MKLQKVILAVAALALTGCEDIPGQLKVFSDMKVISKGKEKVVSTGEYSTSLDFKRDRIVATIESATGKIKLDLNVPDNVSIPENGPFELKSGQSGQPFDVSGTTVTKRTRSQDQVSSETCQVEYYDTICTPQGCTTVPRYRTGYRTIRFYDETVDQKMQFAAAALTNKKETLAQFNGAVAGTRRVVTHQGQCF